MTPEREALEARELPPEGTADLTTAAGTRGHAASPPRGNLISYPSAVVARNSVVAWFLTVFNPARWVRVRVCVVAGDASLARHAIAASDWTLLREPSEQDGTTVLSLIARRYIRIPTDRRDEAAAQIHALLAQHGVRACWIAANDSVAGDPGLYRWSVPLHAGATLGGRAHDSIYLTSSDPIEAALYLNSGEIGAIESPVSTATRAAPVTDWERDFARWIVASGGGGLFAGLGAGLLIVPSQDVPPTTLAALCGVALVGLFAVAVGVAQFREVKPAEPGGWRDRLAQSFQTDWFGGSTSRLLRVLRCALCASACALASLEAVLEFPDTGGVGTVLLVLAAFGTLVAGYVWTRIRRTWNPPRLPWRVGVAAGWLIFLAFLARLVTSEFFGMVGVPIGGIDLDPVVIFGVAAWPMLRAMVSVVAIGACWGLIYRGRFGAPGNLIIGVLFVGIAVGGFAHKLDATLRQSAHEITTGAVDDSLGYQAPWVCLAPADSTALPLGLSAHTPFRKLGDFRDKVVLVASKAQRGRPRGLPRVVYVPSSMLTYTVVAGPRSSCK